MNAELDSVVDGPKIGSKEWAAQIRKEAVSLVRQIERSYVDMARLLYLVYDTPIDNDPDNDSIVTLWGYDTDEEWALAELGYAPSKTRFLRKIYWVIEVRHDIDPAIKARVYDLGISKCRHLVSVLTSANAAYWVDVAENTSVADLIAIIGAYKDLRDKQEALERQKALEADEDYDPDDEEKYPVPTEEEDADIRSLKLTKIHAFPDQHEIIEHALDAAALVAEVPRKGHNGHLFCLICADFLAGHAGVFSGHSAFKHYMATLEKVLDVKLIAIDKDSVDPVPELLWGTKNMVDLIEHIEKHKKDEDDDD